MQCLLVAEAQTTVGGKISNVKDAIRQTWECFMKKVTNELVRDYNAEYDFVNESIPELLKYLCHGFNRHVEGYAVYSFNVQSVSDGSFRYVAKSTRTNSDGDAVGYVAFGNFGSVAECFAGFEVGLRFGLIDWRVDKYYKVDITSGNQAKPTRRVSIE